MKNKHNHLNFTALFLCSSVLFSAPCLGMEVEESKGGTISLKRVKSGSESSQNDSLSNDSEVVRPLKKQRMESENNVIEWLDQNFKKMPDSFLKENGVQELIDFCVKTNLSVKDLRVGLKKFAQEQNTHLSYIQTNLDFCNECIDKTLDANPIIVNTGVIGNNFTAHWIPNETKSKIKIEMKEPIEKRTIGLKTIEEFIVGAEPKYEFQDGLLSVKGTLIGTSDIKDYLLEMNKDQYDALWKIEILGKPILLIDENISCQGASFNFDLSNCKVTGNKIIDLSGNDGTDGGDFICNVGTFENLEQLTIITNGGKGGNGGNGVDAPLNNLGNPHKIEDYSYTHKSGDKNPTISHFQLYPKAMEWTVKGKWELYEKKGMPGMPGGLGGSGGDIIIKTFHDEILLEKRGEAGIAGGKGRNGKTARGEKLTNLVLSSEMPASFCGGPHAQQLGLLNASTQDNLPNIWIVPPHHVADSEPDQSMSIEEKK